MLPMISGNVTRSRAAFLDHHFTARAERQSTARRLIQCRFLPVQSGPPSFPWQESLVTLSDWNDADHLRATLRLGSSADLHWVRDEGWSTWVQLSVVLAEPGGGLNLRRFARAARRVHPDLLGAALRTLEELCRFTRPLLTPHAAFFGLHEQVHGDWADLLDIDTEGRSERAVDRLIRAQGLHAAGDAERLYDNTACHTGLPLSVQLLTLPASKVTQTLRCLLDLSEEAQCWLDVLEGHLEEECSELAFAAHVVTRNTRHDHLADLRDHLDSLESECVVYVARFAPSAAGVRRVMRAMNELSKLSAQGVRLLADF